MDFLNDLVKNIQAKVIQKFFKQTFQEIILIILNLMQIEPKSV